MRQRRRQTARTTRPTESAAAGRRAPALAWKRSADTRTRSTEEQKRYSRTRGVCLLEYNEQKRFLYRTISMCLKYCLRIK
jgi:hypothetical protein